MDQEQRIAQPRWIQFIVSIERVACAIFLSAILGLVTLQIIGRYVLNNPYVWTEEIARFSLVWLTFIGSAFVLSQGRHITVDVVSQWLGPKSRVFLEIIASVSVLAVSIVFLPASLNYTMTMNAIGSAAADVPMSVVYGAGLTGFALIAFHSLTRVYIALRYGAAGFTSGTVPTTSSTEEGT